ncbi:NAD-dependent epimerase [soil metagenome]
MSTTFRSALVTGASGFIASALVQRLVDLGVETFALTRERPADSGAAASGIPAGAIAIPWNPDTPDSIRQALAGAEAHAEVVFHLASAGVQQTGGFDSVVEGNVNLMARLLEALADRPPSHFLYTGSCFEYGDGAGQAPIVEATLPRPLSVYAASKLAAYHCGRTIAGRLGIPFTNLRLFGVYGPTERPHRLISFLIDRLQRGEPADLSPGDQVRDLVYIDDVIEALLKVAEAGPPSPAEGGLYNVCTGVPSRVRDVGELVADLLDRPRTLLRWGALEGRSDEAPRIVGRFDRLAEATGWTPKTTPRQGIARMLEARREARGAA